MQLIFQGGYMAAKKSKLHEQFLEQAKKQDHNVKSDIFENVSVFVNGFTGKILWFGSNVSQQQTTTKQLSSNSVSLLDLSLPVFLYSSECGRNKTDNDDSWRSVSPLLKHGAYNAHNCFEFA